MIDMNGLQDSAGMLFALNLIILLFVTAFVCMLPLITRKTLLFGVRVPEAAAQSPEAARLKRQYVAAALIGGVAVIGLLIVQYLTLPLWSLLACLYFPLLLMAVQYGAFIPQWRKALALKAEKGWATTATATAETRSAVERERLLSFPKGWYALSAVLCLILVAISLSLYPSLPERIVTHWNASMQPDAWSDKSLLSVLMMPLIMLGMVLLMMISNISIYRMKLQVDAENPALSYAQHRIYRRMMSRALGLVTFALTLFLAYLQLVSLEVLPASAPAMMVLTCVLIVLCCVPFVYISIKAGQSGCKLKPEVLEQDIHASQSGTVVTRPVHPGRGDDRFWKLGLFYYNPDDPAILIEDRFGTNGGMNYAHPVAKIAAIALGLLILAVYVGVTAMFFRYLA